MSFRFNPFTNTLDQVGSSGSGIPNGATDPASPSTFDFFYNTTSDQLKIFLYDTWVSFINYRDIMLTDEMGEAVTDENGNPILETNTIDYIRS